MVRPRPDHPSISIQRARISTAQCHLLKPGAGSSDRDEHAYACPFPLRLDRVPTSSSRVDPTHPTHRITWAWTPIINPGCHLQVYPLPGFARARPQQGVLSGRFVVAVADVPCGSKRKTRGPPQPPQGTPDDSIFFWKRATRRCPLPPNPFLPLGMAGSTVAPPFPLVMRVPFTSQRARPANQQHPASHRGSGGHPTGEARGSQVQAVQEATGGNERGRHNQQRSIGPVDTRWVTDLEPGCQGGWLV